MRSLQQVNERLRDYRGIDLIYHDWGYIAWQVSTGENVEEILMEVAEPGKGYGKKLWREFCSRLIENDLPYHSVFGYHMKTNEMAEGFYTSLGFARHEIPDLYRVGTAVLRVLPFATLREKLGV